MALSPLNDYAKIQLDTQGPLSAKTGDAATSGILVEIPATFTHYGYYSGGFEGSLMADLQPLHDYWSNFIGKRTWWLALSEKGAILKEEDGTSYAYVKFTSLMAFAEPDETAESVLDQHGGSFAA